LEGVAYIIGKPMEHNNIMEIYKNARIQYISAIKNQKRRDCPLL
jgi:hypothetical protein